MSNSKAHRERVRSWLKDNRHLWQGLEWDSHYQHPSLRMEIVSRMKELGIIAHSTFGET